MTGTRAKGLALTALALLLVGSGCGGSEEGGVEYPLVTEPELTYQPAVTSPGGAIVQLPSLPTEREAVASPTCERKVATFHDGSSPSRRPIVVPPAPGLRAKATTARHVVRVAWSFESLPEDCRPEVILLSVNAGTSSSATPTNIEVRVTSDSGSTEITYPEFLPVPNVALASAFTRDGRRSRVARVLIDA